jgi:hypothetical protein
MLQSDVAVIDEFKCCDSSALTFWMIPSPLAGYDSIPAIVPSGCHRQLWPIM